MNIIISMIILLILIVIVVFQIVLIKAIQISTEKEENLEYEEIPKKVELTEEQKKKQEELRKNFDNLMKYDYSEALKGKGE